MSCTDAEERKPELLLLDSDTLAKRAETVPVSGGLSYFVSHEGNLVVAASSDGEQGVVLYDVDNERQTKMDGALGLQEFVQRAGHGELWLVDDEALFRLDLLNGQVENVPSPFRPRHGNILPGRGVPPCSTMRTGTRSGTLTPRGARASEP